MGKAFYDSCAFLIPVGVGVCLTVRLITNLALGAGFISWGQPHTIRIVVQFGRLLLPSRFWGS
eukprot:2384431-Amphidinium_carterae.1